MLEGFSKYYDVMSPEDKKALLQAMVSFIELYPEKRDDKHLIKTIHFTFPVTYDGESGALFVRTNELQVETCALLSKLQGEEHIETGISLSKREIGDQP
jgi:site-specific DNA recombinase